MDFENSTYLTYKDSDDVNDSLMESVFFGKYSILTYLCFLSSCFGSYYVFQGQSLSLAAIAISIVFAIALVIWCGHDGWSIKDNLTTGELILDCLVGVPIGVFLIIKDMEWFAIFPFALILFLVSGSVDNVLLRNVLRVISIVLVAYAIVAVIMLLVLGGASSSGASASSTGSSNSTQLTSSSNNIRREENTNKSDYSNRNTNSDHSTNINSTNRSNVPKAPNRYVGIIYYRDGRKEEVNEWSGVGAETSCERATAQTFEQRMRAFRDQPYFQPTRYEVKRKVYDWEIS